MTDKENTSFNQFGLDAKIKEAVSKLGFEHATPIQAATIPPLLEGHDVIGQARTGSGKTAAFGLPLLEMVKGGDKKVKAIVLTPTRELALQVTDALRSFAKGLPIQIVTIYGGAPYPPQLKALKKGVPIVVGTPGRVIDHMERGSLDTSHVEMLVLDEADEMLRMGFIDAVEHVLESLPEDRQIALFSATMPKQIKKIADRFLRDPVLLEVESRALSVDHIEQKWIRVAQRNKLSTLGRLLRGETRGATLIFTKTRKGCAEVADALTKNGIAADAIHGDLNQAARERVLNRMRNKALDVLVATDVAARGLDITHITHVVNYDFPHDTETYVHRIGRTGRAGAKGVAITLVTPREQYKLRFLTKATEVRLEEVQAPSDADIALRQRLELWRQLCDAMDSPQVDDARNWLAEVIESTQVNPSELASAAIHLLATQLGVNLGELPPPGPSTDEKLNRRVLNEAQIFLPIGRSLGVGAGDIVAALANDANVPGRRIGRVTLFQKKSFVGLPEEEANRVLNESATLTVRGHEVRLSRAWNQNEEGPPRKGRANKQGRTNKHGPPNKQGRPKKHMRKGKRRN